MLNKNCQIPSSLRHAHLLSHSSVSQKFCKAQLTLYQGLYQVSIKDEIKMSRATGASESQGSPLISLVVGIV